MKCDIIVVGSGNAALSAALSARERGAKVLVIEKAPHVGGDSRCSDGALRFTYENPDEIFELVSNVTREELETIVLSPFRYTKGDYYREWMDITQGYANSELVEVVVNNSWETIRWLRNHGVEYELYTDGGVRIGNKLYLIPGLPMRARGGGEGLVNYEMKEAEKMGVKIMCNTKATKLIVDGRGTVVGVKVLKKEGYSEIYSNAVILACGGFQANVEMRTRYLGSAWTIAKVRGSRYNTGDGLKMAFEIGAQAVGHYSGCHSPLIDANAPDFESKMEGARHFYHLGIIIDERGKRFVDEGEDFVPKVYAKLGEIVKKHLSGIAYQVFDSKVAHFLPPTYEKYGSLVHANSVKGIAEELGIDPKSLEKTISEFNKAVKTGNFNLCALDGKGTDGVDPPKSNWALPLDTPPFIACPVVGGITFTFGGVRINRHAQVLNDENEVIKGLYACGEIVGGLFYYNYLGGSGLVAGATFGRISGINAVAEGT